MIEVTVKHQTDLLQIHGFLPAVLHKIAGSASPGLIHTVDGAVHAAPQPGGIAGAGGQCRPGSDFRDLITEPGQETIVPHQHILQFLQVFLPHFPGRNAVTVRQRCRRPHRLSEEGTGPHDPGGPY